MKLEWINERWFGFTEDSNMTKAGFKKYDMVIKPNHVW